MDSTLNDNKVSEPGYVFLPHIMVQTISEISFNNRIRKDKINKIYNLGLETDYFLPSKSLTSRYTTKNINSNYYEKVEIK